MFGIPYVAIGIVVAFLAGSASGAYVVHKMDLSDYHALELQYKEAEIAAANKARDDQKAIDQISISAAKRQAATQVALTARAKQQLSEVSKHVKDHPNNCLTVGFVRVLDASVRGVLAGSLAIPAGVSDDTCSGVNPSALANSIVDNYNTAGANKEQLNGLIAVLREMETKHNDLNKKK